MPDAAATPNTMVMPTGSCTGTMQILPADHIKGRVMLREIGQQCAVPFDRLLTGLQLSADTSGNTTIKDLVGAGKLLDVTDVQKGGGELQQ